jgi:hypothetical protein
VTLEQAALPGLKATRRGDITFYGVDDNGDDLVGDVFVGSIYHENGAVKATASRSGGVALAAERIKRNRYRELEPSSCL